MPSIPVLEPGEFVKRSSSCTLIDVRSPREYRRAHFPGAKNIPLFSDAEREKIGKLYNQLGQGPATLEGLGIAGPKIRGFIEQVMHFAGKDKEILLYCWRGGMRSESMAWVLKSAGYAPFLLKDGYKAFRAWTREVFSSPRNIIILGGMTGSGKTEVLHELKAMGQQVIDLEGLACHKGSVFGGLGMPVQPRTEHFENLLALEWNTADPAKPLWLEDESRNIGRITLPQKIYEMMQQAPVMLIDMPFEQRVERLVAGYGKFNHAVLEPMVDQLTQRLGRENAGNAIQALQKGDVKNSISIVLAYYDKAYRHQLAKRAQGSITNINCEGLQPREIAGKLLDTGC